MSTQSAIAKLHTPLRELVAGVAQEGSQEHGVLDKDSDVAQWIENIAQGDIVKSENLKDLDTQLTPRTYVVGNSFTVADVALYGALHLTFARASVRKAAETLAPAFSAVTFDLDAAPKSERKADAPKKKEKAPANVSSEASGVAARTKKGTDASPAANAEKAANDAKTGKKDKKDKASEAIDGGKKKAASGHGGSKAADEGSGEPLPSMIDMRVGHILEVMKHPDADGLYVEQIDFGEETGPRTVVSGLVNYIPIEQMRNRYLVGICNLKPASMRGVKSFAMVLAATSQEGKEGGVELISPPPDSKPGERVYFEGPEFESAMPLSQLNPKKKIFETIQPGFTTLATREAAWVNPTTKSVHRIRTKDGICLAPTFVGASLS